MLPYALSGPNCRRPVRLVRSVLAALAVLALSLSLGGPTAAGSAAEPDRAPVPSLVGAPAPERGSNIIAVLIGL